MQNTNLNTSPYFDDFNSSKNFYKVLYRPGYPVQARELTTSQSILQHQIENFGRSIYKEGSMVVPGQVGYDTKYYAVKINSIYAGAPVESYRSLLNGLTIRGATSNVSATVVNTLAANDPQNTSGYITLFVKYINSSTVDNVINVFSNGEDLIASSNITFGSTIIPNTQAFATTLSSNSTAVGSAAYINNGIYYIRGYFVDVPSQTVILDPFTNVPSYKVGLQINEEIVTPEDDNSLYDNAIGSSNYTAPGAHRLKISTVLVKKSIDDPDTTNFVELLRLKDGVIQTFITRNSYSEIEKEIAKRTYETNGDYYVKPFDVTVRENLSNGTNNGVYKVFETTDEGNTPSESRFSLQISPGAAVVNGFKLETLKNTFIDVDKPRDTNLLTNQTSPNVVGSYLEVGLGTTDLFGMFNTISGPPVVTFYNNYSVSTSSGTGVTIGYARVTNIEIGPSAIPTNGNVYRIFLSDIDFVGGTGTTYTFSDIKSIHQQNYAYVNIRSLLNDKYLLSGTNSIPVIGAGSTGNLTGFLSDYQSELRVGDILTAGTGTSGAIQRFRVQNIVSSTTVSITNISSQSTISGAYRFTVNRPRLENGSDSKLMSILPKATVKTLNVKSLQIRQQKTNLTISSGTTITINADYGCTFSNPVITDFVGFDSSGNSLNITNVTFDAFYKIATLNVSGNTGTATVSFSTGKSNPTEKIKTPKLMQVLEVIKTGTGVTANGLTPDSVNIGTRVEDSIISLGVPDAFALHAVYESTDSNSAVIPNFSSTSTSLIPGEIINGSTSGASARVVSSSGSSISFVYLSSSEFTEGETVTGFVSGSTTTVNSLNNGSPNILDRYTLDSGQRDQIYDFSRIVRNLNSTTPRRRLKVVFDYFDHSTTGDYFSVNSYTGIAYDAIPSYKNISLTDVIDYRIAVNKVVNGSGTVSSTYTVTTKTLDFNSRTSAGISYFNFPKIGQVNIFDIDYYLPRIDKLFLSPEGLFRLVKGQSAENPSPPGDIADSMLLALIEYPAYLYNLNSCRITKYGNKRYTMKDIGDLENRIKNVEYYTQLNLLETDTNNMFISDANGLNRFKNGFLVDNFIDHSRADILNQDYECSVDTEIGGLRPSHYTTNIALEYNSSISRNIQRTGNVLSLPYTEVVSISQLYASRVENVNPFNVFSWIGRIDLTPSSDDWVDTNRLPDSVTEIEGNFASTARFLNVDQNGFAPTEWGAWQTTWTGTENVAVSRVRDRSAGSFVRGRGRPVNEVSTTRTVERQSRTATRTNIVPRFDNQSLGTRILSRTNIPNIRSRNIAFSANRVKPKTRFYPFFDSTNVTNYVTPKLIEISMVSGTFTIGETVVGQTSKCRLKVVAPNDGFSTNPYTSNNAALSSSYTNTSTILNHDINALSSEINGQFYGRIIAGERLIGQTSKAVANVSSSIRLVSSIDGALSGSIFIPDPSVNTNPRFSVGEKIFRLTTSSVNSFRGGEVDSSAEATYTASGVLETVQNNIISTRNAQVIRETTTETRTIATSTRTETRQVGWWDPLAESFLVTSPGGEYVTSVDLYFRTRDDNNIPVSVQIRTMENGTPTKTILPFSDVTVRASNVLTSADGTIPTRFRFQAPVFLKENQEYALVVLSDSNQYTVWVSRMGESDVRTGVTISSQPYAGVLFKSQNASTWTPDQFEDLKFTLYRARFISTTGTAYFHNADMGVGNRQIPKLSTNPIQMVGGGNTITILHSNHGMHGSGNSVTISGAISEVPPTILSSNIGVSPVGTGFSTIVVQNASQFHTTIGGSPVSSQNLGYLKIDDEIFSYSGINGNTINISARGIGTQNSFGVAHTSGTPVECYNLNGVPLIYINGTSSIKNTTLDDYEIVLPVSANTSLNGGGTNVYATQNIQYETFLPQVQTLVLPQTSIIARYKGVSGSSVDGNETSFVFDSEYFPVTLNENNYTSYPKLIVSSVNQLNKLGNQKSFNLELNLINSGTDNFSPIIDLDRLSLIATSNRIRGNIQSISSGSTNPIGDKSKAIYITKLVKLDKPATSIKVMFAAWVPSSANIDLYYKVLPVNSEADVDTIPYTQFSNTAPLAIIPAGSDVEEYKDYEYNVNNLDFGSFAIKIVMRSSNQALVPIIKDLRVIALT